MLATAAMIGVRSLSRGRIRLGSSFDARLSSELIKQRELHALHQLLLHQSEDENREPGTIRVAKQWLQQQVNAGTVSEELAVLVAQSIDVAEVYYREIDLFADGIAQEAQRIGQVKTDRVSELEQRIKVLGDWSTLLRSKLENAASQDAVLQTQLQEAIKAANGRDLHSFIERLSAAN